MLPWYDPCTSITIRDSYQENGERVSCPCAETSATSKKGVRAVRVTVEVGPARANGVKTCTTSGHIRRENRKHKSPSGR